MITLIRKLILVCLLSSSSFAYALDSKPSHALVFQVIQNQMIFNNTAIESATVISPKLPGNQYGISLRLKAPVANQLSDLTESNIGKQANILLNDKVISSVIIKSKLGREFLLTGFTKAEANQFVEGLGLKSSH